MPDNPTNTGSERRTAGDEAVALKSSAQDGQSQAFLDAYSADRTTDSKTKSDYWSSVTKESGLTNLPNLNIVDQTLAQQQDVKLWTASKDGDTHHTLLFRVSQASGTNDGGASPKVNADDIANALKAGKDKDGKPFTEDEKRFLQAQQQSLNDANNPLTRHGQEKANDGKTPVISQDSLLDAYNYAGVKYANDFDQLARNLGSQHQNESLRQGDAAAGADPQHPHKIVYDNGTSREFTYNNGNISSVSETLIGPDGKVTTKDYAADSKTGVWGEVQPDGSIKPNGSSAPRLSPDGAGGYDYTYKSTNLSGDGSVQTHRVNKSGVTETYAAAADTYGSPTAAGKDSKVGGLDVQGAADNSGRLEQHIVTGNNLWTTAQKILNMTPENEDPQKINELIGKIVAANPNITDANQINADTQLVIPAALLPEPVSTDGPH